MSESRTSTSRRTNTNDLRSLDDCRDLVIAFYSEARQDALLGPIFEAHVGKEDSAWGAHIDTISRFWFTVLFHQPAYNGNPLAKHAKLELHDPHFVRWLVIWRATVDRTFTGARAEAAKTSAASIGQTMLQRLVESRRSEAPC